MELIECEEEGYGELARMAAQLAIDERSDEPTDEGQLAERLEWFLSNGFRAYFIEAEEGRVGYCLVYLRTAPVRVHQFFISPEYRRKGYGRQAFEELLDMIGTEAVDCEVLDWNADGAAFAKALGFQARSHNLRFIRHR